MTGFGILQGITVCILRPWEQIVQYVYARFIFNHLDHLIVYQQPKAARQNNIDDVSHFAPD